MKILSFKVNGEVKFGPKVKKQEAVWCPSDSTSVKRTSITCPNNY